MQEACCCPRSAVQHQWDREQFLGENLPEGPDFPPTAWKQGATVQRFTAEVFSMMLQMHFPQIDPVFLRLGPVPVAMVRPDVHDLVSSSATFLLKRLAKERRLKLHRGRPV